MGTFPNKETQFQPGQSGNPAGAKKGTKHLSTWIQEILNDEDFEGNYLDSKLGLVEYKGAPAKAIVKVLVIRAMNGDVTAFKALGQYGYGTKVDITSGGEKIQQAPLIVSEIASRKQEE